MMVKIPAPRGKGDPPLPAGIVGNLDKPETEELVSLNFRVPKSFRRDFKTFAAQNDKDGVALLVLVFTMLLRSTPEENAIERLGLHLQPLKR